VGDDCCETNVEEEQKERKKLLMRKNGLEKVKSYELESFELMLPFGAVNKVHLVRGVAFLVMENNCRRETFSFPLPFFFDVNDE
jgi:hypothetical protein